MRGGADAAKLCVRIHELLLMTAKLTAKRAMVARDTLRTADLMRFAGVGRNTLRFYEAEGLIAKPSRTPTGYRVFAREALADLTFIKHAKDAGLTLAEIKELLELSRADQATCGTVAGRVEVKITDIDAMIAQLEKKKAFLAKFLGTCRNQEPSNRCDVRRRGFKVRACCD